MAYEKTESKVIKEIDKNGRGDKIVISEIKGVTSGNTSIDVRLYYTDDNGELQPTKKGVRFSTEATLEVVQALVGTLSDEERNNIFE